MQIVSRLYNITRPIHYRFRTVSNPFPMTPLQLPRGGGIEDSTAGY